jgi:hypothetical protein
MEHRREPDGVLFGRSIFIEGLFARIMYRSLRFIHERALNGTLRYRPGPFFPHVGAWYRPGGEAALMTRFAYLRNINIS